jgi:stearoyl-CoA desaturase (delta-9 desaturase)
MDHSPRRLDWGNILFLVGSPLAALSAAFYYIPRYGIHPAEVVVFAILYVATGMSITGGYHRHFSHVSYKAHPLMRLFYLVFGACAMQNSALHWATDHRLHHRYTDTDNDPYNAGRGFWWSHMGWVFYESSKNRDFSLVNDLYQDPWVRWQHKYHVAIAMVVGFGIPLAIGFMIGRPFGMLLWGGLFRVIFVHHTTFLINSAAHIWGRQPFSRSDSSRDSWWLAFFTYGEGYHNFHHKFPSDYRNGIRWYQWDPTKWLIRSLEWLGATSHLHRVPDHLILRARMEVEALEAEKHINTMPAHVGHPVRERLAVARLQLEKALQQWGESVARYRDAKKTQHHWPNREEVLAAARHKLKEYEAGLLKARESWQDTLRGLRRESLSVS